jgi:DNA-binding LacI/PurR family transcriptional regulator
MEHPSDQSVRLIIRHLLGLGHCRIGALVPAVRPFGPAMQKWLTAIRQEMVVDGGAAELEIVSLTRGGAGVEGPQGVFPDYVNQNHPKYAVPAGRELFIDAMGRRPQLTALVAYSDPIAVGAILEAQARGMVVGRDVAIAGCGQVPTSFFAPLALTSVDRRPQLYAAKLLALLKAHMDNTPDAPPPPMMDAVEPLLVIGESTVGA